MPSVAEIRQELENYHAQQLREVEEKERGMEAALAVAEEEELRQRVAEEEGCQQWDLQQREFRQRLAEEEELRQQVAEEELRQRVATEEELRRVAEAQRRAERRAEKKEEKVVSSLKRQRVEITEMAEEMREAREDMRELKLLVKDGFKRLRREMRHRKPRGKFDHLAIKLHIEFGIRH